MAIAIHNISRGKKSDRPQTRLVFGGAIALSKWSQKGQSISYQGIGTAQQPQSYAQPLPGAGGDVDSS